MCLTLIDTRRPAVSRDVMLVLSRRCLVCYVLGSIP